MFDFVRKILGPFINRARVIQSDVVQINYFGRGGNQ